MVYHFGCGAHFLHGADPGNAETRSRPGDGVGGLWQLKVHGTVIRRVEKFQPVCAEFQRPRGRRAAILPVSGQRASEMRHLYPDLMMASLYRAGSQLENILPRSHCASRSHGNGAWRLLPRESLLCRHGMCWSFRPLRDNLPDQLPEERECRKPLRGNISQNRKR